MYTQQSYLYEEGFFTLVLVLVLEDEVPSISTTGPLQDKKEEGKEETDREGMGRVGAGRGGGRREREE